MAKKRVKNSFRGNSKNILLALLIVAAAVTVYGIAQAATVSHTPGQVIPQGAGSGLDSDLLQGLTSADILAAVGAGSPLVTWGSGTGGWTPDGGYSGVAAGVGASACPSGWTQVYAGYGPHIGTNLAMPICSTSTTETGITGINPSSLNGASACTPPDYGGYVICNTCRVCVK